MTKETMTIHKGLAELKLLDKRIEKEICNATLCACVKASALKVNGMTVDEFKESTKATYQKINDMIRRRDAIKRAISKSNAITMVSVGGVEYTVAEAIWMNQMGIEAKQHLYNLLNVEYADCVRKADANNSSLDDKAEQFIIAMNGNKTDKAAMNTEEAATAKKAYIDSNTCNVVSGLDVKEEIEKLANEIDSFKAEVDAALSTSNATTMIDVCY